MAIRISFLISIAFLAIGVSGCASRKSDAGPASGRQGGIVAVNGVVVRP